MAVITAVAMVVIVAVAMAVITAVAMVVIVAVATAVAMAVVIRNLIILILINPLEQQVGKIEVMETLLKTPNMKVAEAEEKEESQMIVKYQMRIIINNPFVQVLKLI